MNRKLLLCALIALIVFLPNVLSAETVHLKDGRQFSGKIAEKGDKVELDTGYGVLLIDRKDILKIEGRISAAPKPPVPDSLDDVKEAVTDSITSGEMSEHIHYLASEELEGRMTGTKGMEMARDYIVKEFKSYGLKPCGDSETYLQQFPTNQGDSWNVVGFIEGSDPQLKAQVVVVGGHYDHVGRGRRGQGEIHPGADDNASGTAGVLEIAEAFAEKNLKPKRTVLFMCFGSEEIGLVGSRYYCEHPIFPLEKTVAVLNMDMIARNEPDEAICFGATLSKQLDKILGEATPEGFTVHRRGLMAASDHYSFYVKGVPAVCFNTGMHKDLHQPTDLPYKCNFTKAEKVAEIVALSAMGAADYKGKIEMEKAKEGENPWGGRERRGRRGPRLGITPRPAELDKKTKDKFGLADQDGAVAIEEVAPDSVAEKGGFKAGDILIELGGKKVPAESLWQWFRGVLSDAAGKELAYTVIRDGEKVTGTLKFPQARR